MLKKIIILIIIFYNISFTFWMINNDYLKDSVELCPIKYSIKNNKLFYQYYDIYAESWFCWTGFTHCKEENKWYIIYKSKNFIITTKWIYDIKYSNNFYRLVKTTMIEFNFYYILFFILFIFLCKKYKKQKIWK